MTKVARRGRTTDARPAPRASTDRVPGWQVLRYPGLSRPVVLEEGTGLEGGLREVVRGWTPEIAVTAAPQGKALACVYREARGRGSHKDAGLALHSVFAEEPFRDLDPASAICGLVADLGQAYFDERPGTIALHCGAFRIGGRLVAVAGPRRAGKSTLVARMTAEPGVEVFCDDILPVLADGLAVGLGVAPRLRLPLPAGASALFRDHVAATMGPHDARYGYVCAPSVVPHGTQARLSVLVRLDRRAEGPARLYRMGPDAALTELLSRNMAEQETPEEAFRRAAAILTDLEAVTLVYADLEEAVALLARAFGTADGLETCVTQGTPEPAAGAVTEPATTAPLGPDVTVARNPGVAVRRLGRSAFLWQPGGTTIWQLNPVAVAVWTLLEIPGSAREIAEALAEVFAGVPMEALLADVAWLMDGLVAEGFAAAA